MAMTIDEAIQAAAGATTLEAAHSALDELTGLLRSADLEPAQVDQLEAAAQAVGSKMDTLEDELVDAKEERDAFKEEHGFFERVFGKDRAEFAKLREAVTERKKGIARGTALRIDIETLIDEEASAPEDRRTGLKAKEWKKRIQDAADGNSAAVAAVMQSLHDETGADGDLRKELRKAVWSHTCDMMRFGFGGLLLRLHGRKNEVGREINLQERVFEDGLTTLRAIVDRELTESDPVFSQQKDASDRLRKMAPKVAAVAARAEDVGDASDRLASSLHEELRATPQEADSAALIGSLRTMLAQPGKSLAGLPANALLAEIGEREGGELSKARRAGLKSQLRHTRRLHAADRLDLRRRAFRVRRGRKRLGRRLVRLDKTLNGYHELISAWADLDRVPGKPAWPFAAVTITDRVGLEGPAGGLAPATRGVYEDGAVAEMFALNSLTMAIRSDMHGVVATIVRSEKTLADAVEARINERMSELLGDLAPSRPPEG